MAFQSVPVTAEIVITYTGQGSTMVNVLAALLPGGYSLADVVNLAANVDDEVGDSWRPIQTDEVTYVNTVVRGLEFINDVEATNNGRAGLGGIAGPGPPGNVTFAVKKSSGFTGRSARGRVYWIGMPRASLGTNRNLLEPAAVTEIVLAVETMRARILTAGWTPVIISRFSGGVERETGVTFNWLGSAAVDDEVDSQRRRLLS